MRARSTSSRLDPELDARLVARCLEGDERAWAALVRRHQPLVYAVARSYRLGDEDLGDVFQEVFAALVRGLPRLRDARALCRWLSSTTERLAFAMAVRRRREAAREELETAGARPLLDPGPPIGADLEALEERALVRLALGSLGTRCQELLNALYAEEAEESYRAIAGKLGIPIGSIGPTRARCLERLREALERLEAREPRIRARALPTSLHRTGRTRSGRGRAAARGHAKTPARNRT